MSLIEPTFVFTQSNLQTYRYCRQRFWLRYVRQLIWPAQLSSNQQFALDKEAGSRFHRLVHQHFLGFETSTLRKMAEHDPDSRMILWLDRFLSSPFANLSGMLFPETTFKTRMGENALAAKVDLLQIFSGNQILIYDWKTSSKLPSAKQLKDKLQSKVYPLVISERFKNSSSIPLIKMIYWEANFPDQPVEIVFQEDDYRLFENEIVEMVLEISNLTEAEFVKTDNLNLCNACEYRSYCGRGDTAAAEDYGAAFDIPDYEIEIPEGETLPWG